ncbi:MAG: DUF2017 family protein [Microcella sp.]|uniref:DUF2017 family protein n=1 Tax=Microcella sp. TaxID=1913979 RepID=UPI003314AAD3
MRGFQPTAAGWQAVLEPEEARILLSLSRQLQSLLADSLEPDALADGAVRRLLPDAYRDDPDAAEEWRRLSRRGLVERKVAHAATLSRALAGPAAAAEPSTITIDADDALDWVRAVGDLRLVIADRIGIVVDGDEGTTSEPGLQELYDWLAWIQDDLVRALDGDGSGLGNGDDGVE